MYQHNFIDNKYKYINTCYLCAARHCSYAMTYVQCLWILYFARTERAPTNTDSIRRVGVLYKYIFPQKAHVAPMNPPFCTRAYRSRCSGALSFPLCRSFRFPHTCCGDASLERVQCKGQTDKNSLIQTIMRIVCPRLAGEDSHHNNCIFCYCRHGEQWALR